MIEGWRSKDDNVHTSFGIFYTDALESFEKHRLVDGMDFEDALREVVKETMEATWVEDWCPDCEGTGYTTSSICGNCTGGRLGPGHPWEHGPWDSKVGNKNRYNLLRTIIWFLDQFKDDPAKTIVAEDGTPLVERSFRMELDWGPSTSTWVPDAYGRYPGEVHPEPNKQPYLLCGHLDRVVSFLGQTFVTDRKTTKSSLGDYYFDQYEVHNQMTTYTIASKVVFHGPIRGVMIDAACIQVKESKFARGFTFRTDAQLREWMGDLKLWLAKAEEYAVAGHWPMNDTACFNCRFRKHVCAKDPAVRQAFLETHFTKEDPWNPLKTRN